MGKKIIRNAEWRKKMSLANKDNPKLVKEGKRLAEWNKAHPRKRSLEEIEKRNNVRLISAPKKEQHWNWKGGVTPVRKKLYFSKEYKLWRTAVFERDGYTCIWCGKRGGELQADHIKPWARYPELRFAIDNGRTLCKKCHMTTDTWGVRNYQFFVQGDTR